jgi:Fic family protein
VSKRKSRVIAQWIWQQPGLDAGPGGFEGGLTTRKYASLADVGRVTAYKELTDLVQLGCLVPPRKGGRSSAYDIPWDEFLVAKG